jgi:pyridoxamine 5'-phosphate oxidase
MHDFNAIRREYDGDSLTRDHVAADPLVQFHHWFQDALDAAIPEANAMALATADAAGRPSIRTVLLKSFDERGFTFFTHYDSRKGRELAANPQAALLFFWQPLHRQVRLNGRVERIDPAESDAYFASRPPGARLGAAASPQSRVIAGRGELEARCAELAERYGEDVPRPEGWGGLRLVADEMELWQGRRDRLHDRLRYRREGEGWVIERLAP